MKRFATSVTALAVAGAMSLSVLPAAQAQTAGSSFSYSIEGIAGSLQQFAKLSPELQAEIRAAIEAQDLLKLVQLKLRVDAELAAQQAVADGKTGAEVEVKAPAMSSHSGSSALASVIADGASSNKTQPTTGNTAGGEAKAEVGSSASSVADKITSGSSSRTEGAETKGETGSSASSAVDNVVSGSSAKTEGTETGDQKESGSSANLLGNIDARTILGLTGVTLAVLSFGGLLSSDSNGSSSGSSDGSSAKDETKKDETKKEETKKEETQKGETKKEDTTKGEATKGVAKQEVRGGVAAESQQKQGEVAAKKRGVLAATGESMSIRVLAGIALMLVLAAGFVARRKFAAN
ncbi:hypothetical protein CKALI_04770 [Corynebacterium kalinowskii]|uniref:Secreted protein n=1 Tax=Corynebacterium kalinowskii TaxID=2675216 RepID=A0A6B8V9Q4_9CORY|nr:LPXTG cell wall anchor domain-containing protein [Corynebacterium kalinowskii]QGU01832.1 hypothetical protein CKALI_04770 [Corynebacterium kalinowskii]